MTTEEIKTLIDQKIAGQGSMVDVGGALPTILKEIVDMASQGGGVEPLVFTGQDLTGGSGKTWMTSMAKINEALAVLGEGGNVFFEQPTGDKYIMQCVSYQPTSGPYALNFIDNNGEVWHLGED